MLWEKITNNAPKLFFIFFLMDIVSTHAQSIISGDVRDSLGKPLANANITYSSTKNSAAIQGFSQSAADGYYHLQVNSSEDSIVLKVSYIGYESQSITLKNSNRQHNFTLSTSTTTLKDVIIRDVPIFQREDTLNYNVNDFTSKQDRSIGDVLKKMPGIEVQSNGNILYQGNPIQKLAINGLNLLEGRYGLATNNLPADAVQKVQVVENDQPIKILDSLVFSDRATINLKLKRFLTTGFIKMGVGAKPILWDGNATPMTFNKTFQMINSYQSNNTGNDVAQQLQEFSLEDYGHKFINPDKNLALLSVQNPNTPPFAQDKWLRNNVNLFSTNILEKFKSELEIKAIVSYVNDHQSSIGSTETVITTPTQSVNILEREHNGKNINNLGSKVIIEKNTKQFYLRDKFSAQGFWRNNIGNLLRDSAIYQRAKDDHLNIDNQFKLTAPWGKQLVTFSSQITFRRSPQSLSVTPGQFIGLLNDSLPYINTLQQLHLQSFYTDNAIAFNKGFKSFGIYAKLGFTVNNNHLYSDINLYKDGLDYTLGDDFVNDVAYLRSDVYANLQSSIQKNNWKISITMPTSYTNFEISKSQGYSRNKIMLQPELQAQYLLNPFYTLTLNSSKSNTFGEIQALYDAYIIINYRNIQRQSAILSERTNYSNSLSFQYKSPLNNIFWSVNLSGDFSKNNLLSDYSINSEGAATVDNILRSNNARNFQINTQGSKLFVKLRTTMKIGVNGNFGKYEQLINGDISDINSCTYGGNIGISSSIGNNLTFTYNLRYTANSSRVADRNLNSIKTQTHTLSLVALFLQNQSFTVDANYYANNIPQQNNQVFLNLLYRYTIIKKKIDLELKCGNLLNTKYFTSLYNEGFTHVQSNFLLRPRQFLASMRFSF